MTVEQDWKFTELWNKYDHSKCLNVITARRFFEAGIKAGQEIEWHPYPKEKPKNSGLHFIYTKGAVADIYTDNYYESVECWDRHLPSEISHWAEIPAWLKPPAQEDNASTGI